MIEIVRRYLSHYRDESRLPDSVVEDWLRVLADYPFASIVAVYEREIRGSREFALKLGQFRALVESHAGLIHSIGHRLSDSINQLKAGA